MCRPKPGKSSKAQVHMKPASSLFVIAISTLMNFGGFHQYGSPVLVLQSTFTMWRIAGGVAMAGYIYVYINISRYIYIYIFIIYTVFSIKNKYMHTNTHKHIILAMNSMLACMCANVSINLTSKINQSALARSKRIFLRI